MEIVEFYEASACKSAMNCATPNGFFLNEKRLSGNGIS